MPNRTRTLFAWIRVHRAKRAGFLRNVAVALGNLVGEGVVLHPAVGAIFRSASTIIVALNAQLLRRIRL